MTYKEISDLAQEQLKIDRFNLAEEATRTPNILMRFLDIYREEKSVLIKMNAAYNSLKLERWEYYAGKSPDEVYAEKPFDKKVLRQDYDLYLDADPELSKMKVQIDLQKEKIFCLEKILRGIEQREFSIKNAITMIKHECGEYS
jgi:hypothetical protein